MEEADIADFNFETKCNFGTYREETSTSTQTKIKCGEILVNENNLILMCLYCDYSNSTYDEYKEHIFSEHFPDNLPQPCAEFVYDETAVKNPKISNEIPKTEEARKKSDTKIIPILAKRRSPNLFQKNWKKFHEKKAELTNKMCDGSEQEDNLFVSMLKDERLDSLLSEKDSTMQNNYFDFETTDLSSLCLENESRNNSNKETIQDFLMDELNVFEFDEQKTEMKKKLEDDKNSLGDLDISQNTNSNSSDTSNCEPGILSNDVSPLTCSENIQTSAVSDVLDKEISSCSTKHTDGLFYCPLCPKFYRRFETLRNHHRIHTGERNPFMCPVCEKSFPAKCRLDAHYRVHSDERPFACDKCNRAFRQKQKLKNHLESHSKGTLRDVSNPYHNPATLPILINNQFVGAEDTRTMDGLYQCPLCEKNYKRFDSLKEHAGIHVEGLDHNCPFCLKNLKTYRSLKKHVLMLHKSENFDYIDEDSEGAKCLESL